jgi:hypothetical protein
LKLLFYANIISANGRLLHFKMTSKINPKEYLTLSAKFKANPVMALLEMTQKISGEYMQKMDELKSVYEDKTKKILSELGSQIAKKEAGEVIRGSIADITKKIQAGIKIPEVKDGYTPVKNRDYFDGEDGKTPQKGIDYPSKAQIREMVSDCVMSETTMLEGEMEAKHKKHSVEIKMLVEKIKKDFPKFELKGEDIVREINSLPITPDKQIDAKHIKNLPKVKVDGKKRLGRGTGTFGSNVQYYDLTDQCNGVTKSFTIPAHSRVLAVYSTQFPIVYRPLIDWTDTALTLEMTAEVGAPEQNQTLFILYVE